MWPAAELPRKEHLPKARWTDTRLTRMALGGTTILGQFRQVGECSAPSDAGPMIRSVRLVARQRVCSRRSTPVASTCWINVLLLTRFVGSSYRNVYRWGWRSPRQY